MSQLEETLKEYLGNIRPKDLQTITSMFHYETIDRGDYFLRQGRASHKLSFIQSGHLRIYADTGDQEVTQWIAGSGQFITELSAFVFSSPSRWDIQALTDTVLLTINKTDYNRLSDLVPEWHILEKLFIIHCFTHLENRIFVQLSMSAEERYKFMFDHDSTLFNQVPLQYIASMLGMSPETLSRIRKKLSTSPNHS